MKKNNLLFTHTCLFFLLLTSLPLAAQTNLLDGFDTTEKYTSIIGYESDEGISVYNTGLELKAENEFGVSAQFRASVDGKIDEIDSEDFDIGIFIKEINLSYKVKVKESLILFTVGKMSTGAKLEQDDPKTLGGVMGVRASIRPKEIPLIGKWLKKNNVKVTRIDITRYNSDSEDKVSLEDLNEMDMTSYALHISRGRDLHTFFIHKRPDSSNRFGVTSNTLGAIKSWDGRFKPRFFSMVHKSKSDFVDLDLLVLSFGIEILPKIRGTAVYSRANEKLSKSVENFYDFSFSHVLSKSRKFSLESQLGVKFIRDRRDLEDEEVFYIRLKGTFQ